jgi:excisionase family DNA binding protein
MLWHLRLHTICSSSTKHINMSSKNKPDPKFGYLNVEDAAKMLGISTSTLYKLTARDLIPCYRPSRLIYFKIDELKAWIETEAFSKDKNFVNI